MTKAILTASALALATLIGCGKSDNATVETPSDNQGTAMHEADSPQPIADPSGDAGPRKLYLDEHDVGAGKVSAQDVAGAHQKDLATQGKYGVDYKAYWFDEKEGKIYCLVEAPSAEAANDVHKQAHGLVADKIMQVSEDNADWMPSPGMKLYLDVHHLGAGKVTVADVAAAHQKDLAAQAKYDVRYLNYWLNEESGTVMCLSEAPNADAAIAVHKAAHGLIPDSIEEVSEGR